MSAGNKNGSQIVGFTRLKDKLLANTMKISTRDLSKRNESVKEA